MAKLKSGRHTSQLKADRQTKKREQSNRSVRDKIHFLSRKVKEDLKKKDMEAANKALKEFISCCDKASSRGILHPNTGARKKSGLMRLFTPAAQK